MVSFNNRPELRGRRRPCPKAQLLRQGGDRSRNSPRPATIPLLLQRGAQQIANPSFSPREKEQLNPAVSLRFIPASRDDGDTPGGRVMNKPALSGMGTTRIQLCSPPIASHHSVFTAQQTGVAQQKDSWCQTISAGSGAVERALCHLNQAGIASPIFLSPSSATN